MEVEKAEKRRIRWTDKGKKIIHKGEKKTYGRKINKPHLV